MLSNRLSLHSLTVLISIVAFTGCASITSKQTADKSAEHPKQADILHAATTITPTLPVTQQIATATQTASQSALPAAQSVSPRIKTPPTASTASTQTTTPFIIANANQLDVWQRIRNGFAMPEQDSQHVASFEKWYAARPAYMERMTDRARRYLYHIVEEVDKRGMPMEIALLPMIESAFHPGALSTASASGIWQFIPSTGKNFGMEQNWWYDGRRDVVTATKGALDYLEKLHKMFGSWDLALAAYNAGENGVMRAQARNRKLNLPTDYASLTLPKETRQYVPKLMAVKNIIARPESFGLVLTNIPNKPYFSEVTTTRHIDVKLAAEMAGISLEEFAALNPAHNRPVMLKKHSDVLLLPVESVNIFLAKLESANQPLVSWQAFSSKKGAGLDNIASRYGITTEKLRSVNSIHRSVKASNGQTLLVPLNGQQAENEFTAFNTNLPPTDNRLFDAIKHTAIKHTAIKHTVRKGDTLNGIARRYHVTLASLKSWNKGVKILRAGQHILVAQPALAQVASKPNRNIKRVTSNTKKATPRKKI